MSWRRRIVFLFAGLLLVVGVLWYWALHTSSGARWVWTQAQSASGGRLQAETVSGDFASGFSLQKLRFESPGMTVRGGVLRTRIDVDLLPPRVEILALSIDLVRAELASGESDGEPTDPDTLIRDLQLPVRLQFDDVEVTNIHLQRSEANPIDVSRVALSGSWHKAIVIEDLHVVSGELTLRAGAILELTESAVFRVALNGSHGSNRFGVESAGTVHDYDYNASVTLIDSRFGDLTAVAQGDGSLETLFARTLLVGGEGIEATGTAEVSWFAGLEGAADLDIVMLDLSRVVPAWPSVHPLNGQVRLTADDSQLAVEEGTVRASGLPAVANLNLLFDRDTAEVSGDVDWRELAWPIDAPEITSRTGSVLVSGSLDDWQVAGTIDVGTEQMPDGQFTILGNGDRDSATARIDEGRALGGAVSGEVAYHWRDAQPWTARLLLENVQTTGLLPDWPGSVSGGLHATGTNTPFSIEAQVDGVSGVMRGQTLEANGGFAHDGENTSADALRVRHGDTHLSLDGAAGTAAGIQFSAHIHQLSDYVDTVSGDLLVEGRVSQLENALNLTAKMDQLVVGEQAVEAILLSLDYAELSQEIAVEGRYQQAQFGLSLAGAFDDWLQPRATAWTGEVSTFTVDLADEHSFSLAEPAALAVASGQLSLQGFCAEDGTGAELCLELSRTAEGRFSLMADLKRVPSMLSEHVVDHGLDLTQAVSGTVEWQQEPNGETEGQAELQIGAGRVSSSTDPELALDTGVGRVGFTIRNRRLLSGELLLPMPGVGAIVGEFAVLDVRQGVDSAVTGEVNLSMADIDIAANFSPVIDSIGGRLEGSLALSGSVSEPLLTGSIDIADGGLLYSPIGLQLHEINLEGRLEENRSFQLGGSFRAGDGYGRVVSSADYGSVDHSGLQFRVVGSELQLVNVPELQAIIAPDFEVTYEQRRLGINGSVDITRARIAPTNLAEGRVSESDDVVIVAGELPDERDVDSDEPQIEYAGALDVTLGDSVVIELDLARASLGGAGSFQWQGDPLPVADGRIDVDGNIQAFGQVLEVSEGAIRFPNVPADNPNIRVRAEREIYGNSQVKRAGILVDGSVERPTVEPYTVPMTSEERALTLLVTGSDFDFEQGVGAVDFGTYIAPRLFVSYGIGIFDKDNVISARYDLGRGFGIKASSGSKESGFDLNYRIEN